MGNNTKLLSTASFSSIQQWDVKQFFLVNVNSQYKVERLGNHIIHQTQKIQLSDYPDDEFVILGVSNKIGMFDASVEKGKKIKQKYHLVENNWIAYNPYRINVGSIGIHVPELKGKYISPAYVVFSCKDTLLPEYLWLMMKSSFFNQLIKDSTTGSVRQTLKFEKLAEIKAPIPSVDEQREILKKYHDTLAKADESIKNGKTYSDGLLNNIQSDVSNLKKKEEKASSKPSSIFQTVPYSSTSRWEVSYILKEGKLQSVYDSFKYPIYSILDIQKESLFGLSLKASSVPQKDMIPMLRMPNIVNGEIDCSDLKYIPRNSAVTSKEPDKYLLRKGDFLINRTNSKELVGKAAVFNLDGEYTYASYVIRYRFDTSIVLPEYVNILFMLPIVRTQIDTVSRQTAGQCNINSDEIGSIRIPVPPISKQREIIEKFNSTKDGANVYFDQAVSLREQALNDFESDIFLN